VKILHEAGIIHVDIKLENMLTSGGVIKLCDLAYAVSRVRQLRGLGTPGYMAPELYGRLSRIVNLSSLDIFSSGQVLFELINGVPMFNGETDVSPKKNEHYRRF
jgi:serine/threonine protein kinase